jgi:hypothetical protein
MDTKDMDTQQNGVNCDASHKIMLNVAFFIAVLTVIMLSVVMLNVVAPFKRFKIFRFQHLTAFQFEVSKNSLLDDFEMALRHLV